MIFQTRSKTKCFIYEQPICLIFYFLKSRMSKIVMDKIRIEKVGAIYLYFVYTIQSINT